MTQERIDLANKFVDLILPRLVTQHADAISTNLDGLRLMLNRTDDPRIRADLEASANKLEVLASRHARSLAQDYGGRFL